MWHLLTNSKNVSPFLYRMCLIAQGAVDHSIGLNNDLHVLILARSTSSIQLGIKATNNCKTRTELPCS